MLVLTSAVCLQKKLKKLISLLSEMMDAVQDMMMSEVPADSINMHSYFKVLVASSRCLASTLLQIGLSLSLSFIIISIVKIHEL